jgi:putative oxidoreductase
MLDSNSERLRGYGLLVLRIVVGVTFFAHGWLKFHGMGIAGTTGFFTNLGIPVPALTAWVVVLVEMFGGLALILGIFTLPAGLLLAADMIGVLVFAKHDASFIGPKSYELELNLLTASLAVALSGPGTFSLAQLLRGKQASQS